ncbi:MAG: SDR family NAD(P)-dependent oxidoreductase [Treponema sp.]|jgi:short-subunit dehydrogenase|nr:SDR family NAD(P)-dependent oxidoreductase [Treponema sp.]
MRFKEKYGPYALVAGGSYGLGGAFAEALARRGLNLVLLARGKERLEETAKRLGKEYSVDVLCRRVDLADFEKAKGLLEDINLPIGLLVYNAAFAPIGWFGETAAEDLDQAAAVNVRTPLLLAKLLSGPMAERRRGGIVLMSSLAGGQGSPKLAAYAATKAFNAVLAEGLWKELKPQGIDVIGCAAGAIRTPGYEKASQTRAAPGTLSAGEVAEQTLKALGKGPVVIPGGFNRFARFIMARLLSRQGAVSLMAKNTGGLS